MLTDVRLLLGLAWLSRVGVLLAQTSGQIYHVGGDVSAPIVIQKHEPDYTEEACKAARQGIVVLSLVVSSTGRPRDVKVVSVPLGFGLDEQAAQAIPKWRFKPAMKDGKAVSVYAKIEVNFQPSLECSAAFLNKAISK